MAGLADTTTQVTHSTSDPATATSARVVDAPIWKSIRFRLTGWYALLVFVLILGLSVALHTLLVATLSNDAEGRLRAAAEEIAASSRGNMNSIMGPVASGGDGGDIALQTPDEAALLLSGVWFQFYDRNQEPIVPDDGRSLSQIPLALEAALTGPEEFWSNDVVLTSISVGGVESMVLFQPLQVYRDGELVDTEQPLLWLVVGEPLGSREKLVSITDQSLFLFGTLGAVIAVWIGWIMAGRALKPVTRVMESANDIARADGGVSLSRRLEVPNTGDELSQLAMTFNAMLDRIERAFATQQRFVADASHELRTPLTAVRGTVDVMLREIDSGRELQEDIVAEDLQVVKRESGRMSRLIEDLLTLARTDGTNVQDILKSAPVQLDELAADAVRVASQLPGGDRVALHIDTPVQISGDSDRLVQVMIILLDNALRHTPADGSITLSVDTAVDPESGRECGRFEVADTGEGIPAEHVPNLFERFYRVEVARSRASGGTGLGLSIALALVRGHHGWIDVRTKQGEGTAFTVWLPLVDDTHDPDQRTERRLSWGAGPLVPRPIRIRRQGQPKPSPHVEPHKVREHGEQRDA